jgi:hypothetical protein
MEASDKEEAHPLSLKSSLQKSVGKLVQHKVILKLEGQYGIKINPQFSLLPPPIHAQSTIHSGQNVKSLRKEHAAEFWSTSKDAQQFDIDRIWIIHENEQEPAGTIKHEYRLTPLQLKERYLYTNTPCIIQNATIPITNEWINEVAGKRTQINTNWFLDNIGSDTKVPIRINQTGFQDGRAAECLTLKVTMKQWIEEISTHPDPQHYLKDWHMQSFFQDLYSDPIIFQDVLNPFLIEIEGGDYRFVYWGGKGTATGIHSDVLNSFSWSYNVIGTKRWTFYHMDDIHGSGRNALVVDQCQGEMMYVPSGWRHSVENLEEAISVNHNWMMVGSLDCVFDCVVDEIRAVEEEMDAWGITNPSAENNELSRVREDMLRGCVGMDISMFCTLVISCYTDCLLNLTNDEISTEGADRDKWLDFSRIVHILVTILETTTFDEVECMNDKKGLEDMVVIDLLGRLKSTLGAKNAKDIMKMMHSLYDFGCHATNTCKKEM